MSEVNKTGSFKTFTVKDASHKLKQLTPPVSIAVATKGIGSVTFNVIWLVKQPAPSWTCNEYDPAEIGVPVDELKTKLLLKEVPPSIEYVKLGVPPKTFEKVISPSLNPLQLTPKPL